MPDYLAGLRLTCSPAGSILPMTFVCVDGTQGDYLARQATASGDVLIGVSQIGYDLPPGFIQAVSSGTATYTQVAAQPGEEFQAFHSGDVAPLVLGSGG